MATANGTQKRSDSDGPGAAPSGWTARAEQVIYGMLRALHVISPAKAAEPADMPLCIVPAAARPDRL